MSGAQGFEDGQHSVDSRHRFSIHSCGGR
jgi:hypothetical protein